MSLRLLFASCLLCASVAGSYAQQEGNGLKTKQDVTTEESTDGKNVFDVVDEMPEFPGGQAALMQFLGSNVNYPADAEKLGIQGRVLVSFVVEIDGSISNVEVMEKGSTHTSPYVDKDGKKTTATVTGSATLLAKEAVRVVESMPLWNPGKRSGSPVRVRYTLPVTFRLK